jgi:hypothetical protein
MVWALFAEGLGYVFDLVISRRVLRRRSSNDDKYAFHLFVKVAERSIEKFMSLGLLTRFDQSMIHYQT